MNVELFELFVGQFELDKVLDAASITFERGLGRLFGCYEKWKLFALNRNALSE